MGADAGRLMDEPSGVCAIIPGESLFAIRHSLFACSLRFYPAGIEPLQHSLGSRIGLLALHAPIFQLFERNRQPGHRAAHEGAGPYHAEIAVEIADLGFSGGRAMIEAVEHLKDLPVGPALPNPPET
jgi:hypothetical protein